MQHQSQVFSHYRNQIGYSIGQNELQFTHLLQLTNDAALQYTKAMHLCIIVLFLLVLSLPFNYFENNVTVIAALGISFSIALILLLILLITKKGSIALIGNSVMLIFLGMFLLCFQGAPDGSSLFWFLLLPPLLMFCVGLLPGTILFLGFYLLLMALLLTPLDSLLAQDISKPLRWRLLASMLGIFIFSWLAEYIRTQMRNALIQSVKMLEHSALTDPLTSLGNRRDFQNYFTVNQAQLKRSSRMFSIAMVDLDFFKQVNDSFGHAVGDQVLCHVGSLLAAYLRASDRIFRWGGEEFVILMPDTKAADAFSIMERLRHEVEITPFITEDGQLINMTISIGLHSGALSDNVDSLITEADTQLYLAKRSGRNQVKGEKDS